MNQTPRGNFRKKESLAQQFRHSCMGQIIIFAAIFGAVSLLAYLTRPSEETVRDTIRDDIRQCIEEHDSLSNDWIDDIVSNAAYMFTTAKENKVTDTLMMAFDKYNLLEYYHHPCYSTVYLRNNFHPESKRCGLGIFGVVIPMLNYNDLLLSDELMQADTLNQRLINDTDGDYFGENPGLEPYRFRGE